MLNFTKPFLSTTKALQLFQVMRQGAVILTSILFAKSHLSTAEIGAYEMLLYTGTVVTFFWVNGLLQAMTPVYAKLENEERKVFIFNNFFVFLGLSLLLFLGLFFGKSWVLPALTGMADVPCFGLFSLYLLFNLPTFPVEYIYLLQNKPLHIVLWGIGAFGLQVVALFLPVYLGKGISEGLQCLVALSALKFIWTAALVWRDGQPDFRPDIIKKYLGFAAPLMLTVVMGNFIVMFDNWLVGWWYRDEAVFAVYRYGARELPLATSLATALGVSLIPRISADLKEGLAMLKSMSRKLFHFLFPVTIVLVLVSKPLFPWIFNPDFAASATIFNIYLLMTATRLLLPNSIVLALGAPKIIFVAGMLELAIKIPLAFLFIHFAGLAGVAWSAVLSFWIEKLVLMWYLDKKYHIKVAEWLDLRLFAGYTLLLFIVFWWAQQSH